MTYEILNDSKGNLLLEKGSFFSNGKHSSNIADYKISYSYDSNGNVIKKHFSYLGDTQHEETIYTYSNDELIKSENSFWIESSTDSTKEDCPYYEYVYTNGEISSRYYIFLGERREDDDFIARYDDKGNLIYIRADGKSTWYYYDDAGDLLKCWGDKNCTYYYNDDNRLVRSIGDNTGNFAVDSATTMVFYTYKGDAVVDKMGYTCFGTDMQNYSDTDDDGNGDTIMACSFDCFYFFTYDYDSDGNIITVWNNSYSDDGEIEKEKLRDIEENPEKLESWIAQYEQFKARKFWNL